MNPEELIEALDAKAWETDYDRVVSMDDIREIVRTNLKPTFTCAARRGKTDPPQDCDWPFCGCDPHADKVIAHLQECNMLVAGDGDTTPYNCFDPAHVPAPSVPQLRDDQRVVAKRLFEVIQRDMGLSMGEYDELRELLTGLLERR